MKVFRKHFKYIILFSFFLLVLLLFINNSDTIWNYGFSHAIRIGEIPYKDFNIISTPLYAFILSIGLFIKDTYLVFLIEQAIMCTLFIYIIEKLIGKNYLLVLISISFPVYYILFPNYNFLCLFLLVLLLYLEKEKKNDALIGILLGLIILSKHTIGITVLLFSLLSTLNFSKSIKRFLYSLIPVSLFIIYLFITKSFKSFINLSILGLFDFGKSNVTISIFSLIIFIGILLYSIYSICKDKKNIYNYYLLSGISFVLPICDLAHIFYFVCLFVIVFLLNNDIQLKSEKLVTINILFMILIFIINIIFNYNTISGVSKNNLKSFSAMLIERDKINYVKNILKEYNKYDKSRMISMSSMFFDIESGKSIDYFDVPLYGNFGYDGVNYMKKKIDNCHNCYFFVSKESNKQFANELGDYIKNKYSYVDSVENFEIYKISR